MVRYKSRKSDIIGLCIMLVFVQYVTQEYCREHRQTIPHHYRYVSGVRHVSLVYADTKDTDISIPIMSVSLV